MELCIDVKLFEYVRILKWFKYRSSQFRPEIDFTNRPVSESQLDDVARNVLSLHNVIIHTGYSNGAIFLKA